MSEGGGILAAVSSQYEVQVKIKPSENGSHLTSVVYDNLTDCCLTCSCGLPLGR